MTVLNVISGNYKEVAQTVFDSGFANAVLNDAPYQSNLEQIFKDLPRSNFLSSHAKGLDDFVRDWVNTDSLTFTQGNITASVFDVILINYILTHAQEADDFDIEAHMRQKKALSFAYYDEDGIACGVAWSYTENNPSLWTASIIRNTTAAPEAREVLVISSPALVQNKGQACPSDEAYTEFLAFLKSQAIARYFEKAILDNAQVDIDVLHHLKAVVEHEGVVPSEHPMLLRKRQQFEALIAEDSEAKDKLESSRQLSLNAVHDSNLDLAANRHYFRRNMTGIVFTGVLVLAIVACALFLGGVLAPLGLAVMTGLSSYVATVAIATVSIGVAASVAKISLDESKLSQYQSKQAKINASFDAECHALDSSFELRCRENLSTDEADADDCEAARQSFPGLFRSNTMIDARRAAAKNPACEKVLGPMDELATSDFEVPGVEAFNPAEEDATPSPRGIRSF